MKRGGTVKKLTYRQSGVDIEKEEQAIKGILSSITSQRTGFGKPLGGHYAGLIDFGDYALVLCTDGVGSKVKIASEMKKWDTVGIDCIAMNVNDALCVGAEPLAFVDYLAIDDPDPAITKELGKGLEQGAKLSNISIVGGETASLPEIINGFDLAGTCLAYVKKDNIITGEAIAPGDVIIGLASSGLHSNGYSLARKVIQHADLFYQDTFPTGIYPGKNIGEVLLTPTQIYVKEILQVLKKIKVHGLAHITGSGVLNLPRLKKGVQFVITDPCEPQPIFTFLQEQGGIDTKEMHRTFNMGMGFAIVVDADDVETTIKTVKKHAKIPAQVVGQVKKGHGVTVPPLKLAYKDLWK